MTVECTGYAPQRAKFTAFRMIRNHKVPLGNVGTDGNANPLKPNIDDGRKPEKT
jgi:hypothetical protein